MSINLKNLLLTSTALVAMSMATPALAVEQNHNANGGGDVVLTVGNSAIWSGTAAGLDERFTVADGVAIGEGGVIVSPLTLDGVGTLYFEGDSTATGTIGSSGNSVGLISAIDSVDSIIDISGNTFADVITSEVDAVAGISTVFQFAADVTSTTLNITNNGDVGNNNTTANIWVTGDLTNTGTINITATNECGNCEASLVLKGTTNALGAVVFTNNSPNAGITDMSSLTFSGTATQNVSGTIDGNVANRGYLRIDNTGGSVIFADAVGNVNSLGKVVITDGDAVFSDTLEATTTTIYTNGTLTTNAVATTGIVFAGASSANINNGLIGTIDFIGNDATVTLADGSDVSSNIDNTVVSKGTLNISGTSTIGGNIGATERLKEINLNGVDGKTATFSGSVAATTITTGAGIAKFDGALTAIDLNITGAGASTFSSTVGATNIITGTGATTFGGALTVTDLDLTDTGNVTFSDTVDAATIVTGAGIAKFDGALTVTDLDISGIARPVFSNTVDAGTITTGSSAVTFGGALTATNLNLTGAGDIIFSDTVDATTITTDSSAVTFDGAMTSTDLKITGMGVVTFNSSGAGAIDFDVDNSIDIGFGWIGAIDTSTVSEGTVTFSASAPGVTNIGATNVLKRIEITGAGYTVNATNVNAPDVLALGDHNVLAASGTFDTLAGQKISLTITSVAGTDYSRITADGISTVPDDTILTVNLAEDESVIDLDSYTIITGDAGSTYGDIIINSIVPGWEFTGSTVGDNYVLTANEEAITSNEDYAHLQIIAANDGGIIDALEAAIFNENSEAVRNELIEATLPTVDGSSQITLIEAVSAIQGVADNRIASLRSGNAASSFSGRSAGSLEDNNSSVWIQGYYSGTNKDVHENIGGYTSNTSGIMIGIDDGNIFDDSILGLAFNYGVTSADSSNANRTGTDILSYGLTFYGNYGFEDNVFIDTQFGYAYNMVETQRGDCGGAGLVCNGDTSNNQFFAKFAVGHNEVFRGGTIFTPKLSAAYVSVHTAGYTEEGTGTNLIVRDSAATSLNLGFDLDLSWKIRSENTFVIPSISGGYSYDALGDETVMTSTFVGGGGEFKTMGANIERHALKAGASVVYEMGSTWGLFTSYDAVLKSGYTSNNAAVSLKANF